MLSLNLAGTSFSQTVEWLVKLDAVMLIRHHCNALLPFNTMSCSKITVFFISYIYYTQGRGRVKIMNILHDATSVTLN